MSMGMRRRRDEKGAQREEKEPGVSKMDIARNKQSCPHCGHFVEPIESDTPAGMMLICPECYKLMGRG